MMHYLAPELFRSNFCPKIFGLLLVVLGDIFRGLWEGGYGVLFWFNFFVKNADDFKLVQVLGLLVWKILRWDCLSDCQEATGGASPQPFVLSAVRARCASAGPADDLSCFSQMFTFFISLNLFEIGLNCWTWNISGFDPLSTHLLAALR